MVKNVEIMAPVGSYESLHAAIKAGANSVYFGIEQLNMRSRSADNFTIEDLGKIVGICQEHNVRTYLALNTIMYDHDLKLMRSICDAAKKAGLSAVILADIAALQYARSIGLEVHMSTQTNISNLEAVKFYAQYADVVVLARELTIQQIKHISSEIVQQNIRGPCGNLIQIEIFVHGALCVAISGKCYMSLHTYNASANRGACLQNCRRSYRVTDEETGDELIIDNKYVMSPKDLCTIGYIDKILDAGVAVVKIEGRGRSPDYVYTVVKVYREALEAYNHGAYTPEKITAWTTELETVFNRGFWHGGYYLGKQGEEWSGAYGSKASKEKTYVGRVENYFDKTKIVQVTIESGKITVGDEILFTGTTTGVVYASAQTIMVEDQKKDSASKGTPCTFHCEEKVRKNDKVYVIKDNVVKNTEKPANTTPS